MIDDAEARGEIERGRTRHRRAHERQHGHRAGDGRGRARLPHRAHDARVDVGRAPEAAAGVRSRARADAQGEGDGGRRRRGRTARGRARRVDPPAVREPVEPRGRTTARPGPEIESAAAGTTIAAFVAVWAPAAPSRAPDATSRSGTAARSRSRSSPPSRRSSLSACEARSSRRPRTASRESARTSFPATSTCGARWGRARDRRGGDRDGPPLAAEEGILVGISSGANVVAALRLAAREEFAGRARGDGGALHRRAVPEHPVVGGARVDACLATNGLRPSLAGGCSRCSRPGTTWRRATWRDDGAAAPLRRAAGQRFGARGRRSSRRGAAGGCALARPADSITVREVRRRRSTATVLDVPRQPGSASAETWRGAGRCR